MFAEKMIFYLSATSVYTIYKLPCCSIISVGTRTDTTQTVYSWIANRLYKIAINIMMTVYHTKDYINYVNNNIIFPYTRSSIVYVPMVTLFGVPGVCVRRADKIYTSKTQFSLLIH